ncbi:MAG: hypothetical protein V2I82_13735 [Halieaceae bacterium]|nr:hypothetical protein [Halieaceae bacterium]
MSLFRVLKYSSLLYFLGKHRGKLFRSLAVLLFALITSLLYDDLRIYLESQHPESLLYALIAKVVIVYGSLLFVLLQFRPGSAGEKRGETRAASMPRASRKASEEAPKDRLAELADVERHTRLRSRYERVLAGEDQAPTRSSTKSSRS